MKNSTLSIIALLVLSISTAYAEDTNKDSSNAGLVQMDATFLQESIVSDEELDSIVGDDITVIQVHPNGSVGSITIKSAQTGVLLIQADGSASYYPG